MGGWRKKGEKRRKLKLQPNGKQKKELKKKNAPEKNLNVVMSLRNLKKRRQRRKVEEAILNQANLKRRRPRLQILKVRKTLKRNPKSIRERRKNPPVKNLRVKRKDPERNTRRKRNTRSIRRTRNIRSTRRGKMTAAARMPVMMKKKKSL